jgi:RNA polymerase sigma factor (sigma-70 family)
MTSVGSFADAQPFAVESDAEFEAAISALLPDVLRYFTRRVRPAEDAADCASEASLIMWQHRRRLPAAAADQRGWAFRIARHVLLNHSRKRVRRATIDASLRAGLTPPPVELSERAERALAALETLSEPDRELVRLVIWEGFGVAEAGSVMRLAPGTARKRYQRARERLRAVMGEGLSGAVVGEDLPQFVLSEDLPH